MHDPPVDAAAYRLTAIDPVTVTYEWAGPVKDLDGSAAPLEPAPPEPGVGTTLPEGAEGIPEPEGDGT